MEKKFEVTIAELDNAAFVDNQSAELARILRSLANKLEHHVALDSGNCFILRDLNGNHVGEAKMTKRKVKK